MPRQFKSEFDPDPFAGALAGALYCAGQKVPYKQEGQERNIYAVLPNKEYTRCPLKWMLQTTGEWINDGCEIYLDTQQKRWEEAIPDIGSEVLIDVIENEGYPVTRLDIKSGAWYMGVRVAVQYGFLIPAYHDYRRLA